MSHDTSNGGIGFCGALTLLFVGLKLGGVIHWSWWWVLAPMWGGFALVFVVLFIGAMVIGSRRVRR